MWKIQSENVKGLANSVFSEIRSLDANYFPIEIVISYRDNEIIYKASDKFSTESISGPFYRKPKIVKNGIDLKKVIIEEGRDVLRILKEDTKKSEEIYPQPTFKTEIGENTYTIKIRKKKNLTDDEGIRVFFARSSS